jgi:hypothetical protein
MLHTVRIAFGLVLVACEALAYADTPDISQAPLMPVSYLAPDQAPKFPAPPKRYNAPLGFEGHRWGEPPSAFTRLPEKPQGIGAAWTSGKVTSIDLNCRATGPAGCSIEDYLRASRLQRLEGGGFHVLTEYYIENQGFKLPTSGVVVAPVVYQFCANWESFIKEVPEDIEKLRKFCGVRMLFQSETRAQLRDLPADHVTRYDLVLSELISRYGKPANFTWRGHVMIEPVSGPVGPASRGERKFDTWRWCPAPRDGLMTRCRASIVLTLDPDQGRGIVLISTPAVWQYAMARESGDAKPDPLYTLLHALSLKYRTEYAHREEQRYKAEKEAEARKTGLKKPAPEPASGTQ